MKMHLYRLIKYAFLSLTALLLIAKGYSQGNIIFVDAAASGPVYDGQSWATAYADLQDALTIGNFQPGDTVWVAAGTYYPTQDTNRLTSFQLRNNLAIYGGFRNGDSLFSQRNFSSNATYLNGDIGIFNDDSDNSFSVVSGWATDSTAVIDGFIITKGRATDPQGFWVNGGGMYNNQSPGFTGPTITNCTFVDNWANQKGGAIWNYRNSPHINNCIFIQNFANEGGAIFNDEDAESEIRNSTFLFNTAQSYGGAIEISQSSPVLVKCTFQSNQAINFFGGAGYITDNSNPVFSHCTLQGNRAGREGGALRYALNSGGKVINCLLTGNRAEEKGGGIATVGFGSNPEILNTTLSANYALETGGVYHNSSSVPLLRNSILYDNRDGQSWPSSQLYAKQISISNVDLRFCLVQNIPFLVGQNNLNADPQFFIQVDPATQTPTLTGDFRIRSTSPAINAGENASLPADEGDLDGDGNTLEPIPRDLLSNVRVENDTVDLGSYEMFTLCKPLGSSSLVQVSGPVSFCEGNAVTLTMRTYPVFSWSNGVSSRTQVVDTTATLIAMATDTAAQCSTSDTVVVTVWQNPAPTLLPASPSFCAGDSLTLSLASAYPSYLWSDGSGDSSLLTKNGGTFWVTVTDSNGCQGSDSVLVTAHPKPALSIFASQSVPFCQGDTVVLDAGAGFLSYSWSGGGNTQTLQVFNSGTYAVTVMDSNGCAAEDSITLNFLPRPVLSLTVLGNNPFCPGDTLPLDAGIHNHYLWNTGDTTQILPVTSAGTYAVTVRDNNQCSTSDSVQVSTLPAPTPGISASGDTVFCDGDSVILAASGFNHYLWSTGDTTSSIVARSSGTYRVTVTDANGCQAQDSQLVVVNPNPTPGIIYLGSSSFCFGTGNFTVLEVAGNYASYLWNRGDTTNAILVTNALPQNSPVNFSVTVTDNNGCSGTASAPVTVFSPPTPTIQPSGSPFFCAGDSITLDAGIYTGYQWNTGASSRFITVKASGTYSVTVTDANGCSGSASILVAVSSRPIIGGIIPNGPTTFCQGDSVSLDAGIYAGYLWSTGETTRQITAKNTGTYTVVVFNSAGCTDTAAIAVTANPNPQVAISPGGSPTLCTGDSLVLDAGVFPGASYLWSTGDTTSTLTIHSSGTYHVTVTDINGCIGRDTVTVSQGVALSPSIIPGNSLLCAGTSLTLDAGSGYASYLWSTGATSRYLTVFSGGSYHVTVSSASGCSGSDTVTITQVTPPTPVIVPGDTTICSGTSVTFSLASSYTGYAWSTGSNNASIQASTAGSYAVVVTDSNQCQGTDTVSLTVANNPQIVFSPGNNLSFCDGDSVVLGGGSHQTYLWTQGGLTLGTGPTLTVYSQGTYQLTVTNAQGCTDTDSALATVFNTPVPVITPSGPTNLCQGDSVTLDAGPGYAHYLWNTGDTTQSITVSAFGIYRVTVFNASGCSGSASINVAVFSNPAPVIIPGDSAFCQGRSLQLFVATNFPSYSWSTGGSLPFITVNSTGQYWVEVTNSAGCTGRDTVDITVYPLPVPSISPGGSPAFCQGDSLSLDAGAGFLQYLWSPNGETSQTLTVSTGGTYGVTVTDANGCTGIDSVRVTELLPPVVEILASGQTRFCQGDSVVLQADTVYASYLWSTGDTTPSIAVAASGSYWLSASDAAGCFGRDTMEVTVLPLPSVAITSSGPSSICAGDTLILDAGAGFASYVWSTGDTTQSLPVFSQGTFAVTVTDSNGCAASDTIAITVNALPLVSILPPGPIDICQGGSVTLDPGTPPTPVLSYLWSTGSSNRTLTVNTGGLYWVTATTSAGCSASDTVQVNVIPQLNVTITTSDSLPICAGETVDLDPGPYAAYLWTSNGQTVGFTRILTVDSSGTYYVTVTDAAGCQGTDSLIVNVVTPPSPNIQPPSATFCDGDSALLDAGTGFFSYLWSTGESTASIWVSQSGQYLITVLDTNRCVGRDTATVTVLNLPPVAIVAQSPTTFCEGDSVRLDGGSYPNVRYRWSTGEITRFITATDSGWVTLAVTDTLTGCTAYDSVFLQVNPAPRPVILPSGPTTFCDGDSVILNAGSYAAYDWTVPPTAGSTSNSTYTAKVGGNYSVLVTDTNGCTGSGSILVTVNPKPVALITPGSTSSCSGRVTSFTATNSQPGIQPKYVWSTGDTTSGISVSPAPGNYSYSVTISDATSGCSDTAMASLSVFPSPAVRITHSNGTTMNDTLISPGCRIVLNATASGGLPGYSYRWKNGSTGTSITLFGPDTVGIYVQVTDQRGCTASDTVRIFSGDQLRANILAFPPPINPGDPTGISEVCAGQLVSLDGGPGFQFYVWTYPNGAQQFSRSISAADPGEYSLLATASNGCLFFDTARVQHNPLPTPTITASGSTVICEGDTVTLCGNAGYVRYFWSNGQTTRCISVDQAGTYILNVEDQKGCIGSDTIVITKKTNPRPRIVATGSTNLCAGDSVILSTFNNWNSYLWTPTGQSSQSIIVKTTGKFLVTVADTNGCLGQDSIQVTVSPTLSPMISAGGDTSPLIKLCAGDTATLFASPGGYSSYRWTTLDTTQILSTQSTLRVGNAGTFVVLVQNSFGCSGRDTVTTQVVSQFTPTITPPGPINFCQGDSVILDAGNYAAYQWSNGKTTRRVTIKSSGTYTVLVTDANGCPGNPASRRVTVYPKPNNGIVAGGPTAFCNGDSVQLYAGNYPTTNWSNGQTLPSIYVKTSGIYSVFVRDTNNCSNTFVDTVTVYANPQPAITTSNGLPVLCAGTTVTLDAGPYSQYLWNTGATTRTLTRSQAGTYSVRVVDNKGCIGRDTLVITQVANPVVSIQPQDTSVCQGRPVFLDAGPGFASYQWQLNGSPIPGDTAQVDTVYPSSTGLYGVRVTDANGCIGRDTIQISVNAPTQVAITASPQKAPPICTADSLMLDAGPGFLAYQWVSNRSGLVGSSRIFKPGYIGVKDTLTVFATDTNGCVSLATYVADIKLTVMASFAGLNPTYCENGDSDTLQGLPPGGLFAGPGMNLNIFDPNQAGPGQHQISYTYVHVNGCASTARQTVSVIPVAQNPSTNVPRFTCNNEPPLALAGNPVGGAFSGPGVSSNIFSASSLSPGTYTIDYIISQSGCSSSTTDTVSVLAADTVNFTGLPAALCNNAQPVTLTPSHPGGFFISAKNAIISSGGIFRYSPLLAGTGLDTVTFIFPNANGICESRQSKVVNVLPPPNVSINVSIDSVCSNATPVRLRGNPGGGTFSGPGVIFISPNYYFDPTRVNPGASYLVDYTYTDGSGCSNVAFHSFYVPTPPRLFITGLSSQYCPDEPRDTVVLGSPAGGWFSGPGIVDSLQGIFDPAVAGAGAHSINYTFVDSFATFTCTFTTSQSVTVTNPPNLQFAGLRDNYCANIGTIALQATPFGGFFTGDDVITGPPPVFTPRGPGFYDVSYIYDSTLSNGKVCVDTLTKTVRIDTLPVASFFVQVDSTTLAPLNASYCVGAIPQTLAGFPKGGLFTGRTINGSIFDPAILGNILQPRQDTIRYVFVDGNLCSDTAQTPVSIVPFPTANIQVLDSLATDTTVLDFCFGDGPIPLKGSPTPGTYSIISPPDTFGLPGGVFDPGDWIDSVVNLKTLLYTYDDGIGCTATATFLARIVPPQANMAFDRLEDSYCVTVTSVPLNAVPASPPGTGVFLVNGSPQTTLQPNALGAGTHLVQYVYFRPGFPNFCPDTVSKWVEVTPQPQVSFNSPQKGFCTGDPAVNLTGNPFGGRFQGTGIVGNSNIFDPDLAGAGDHEIRYIYADSIGCADTASTVLLVREKPTANFTAETVCLGEPTFLTNQSIAGTGALYTWTIEDSSYNGFNQRYTFSTPETHFVKLSVSFAECLDSVTKPVYVHPLPEVGIEGDLLVYLGDTATFWHTERPAGSYFWSYFKQDTVYDAHPGDSLNTYVFRDTGLFVVELLVQDELTSCFNTDTHEVNVTFRPYSDYALTLYPNPTDGQVFINIDLDESTDVIITVYDRIGRLIGGQSFQGLPAGLNKLELGLEGLAEGLYVLRILGGEGLLDFGEFEPGIFKQHKFSFNKYRKVIIKH